VNVGQVGGRYDTHSRVRCYDGSHPDSNRADFLPSLSYDDRSRELYRAEGLALLGDVLDLWSGHGQQDDLHRSREDAWQLFACRPDHDIRRQTIPSWLTVGQLHAFTLPGLFLCFSLISLVIGELCGRPCRDVVGWLLVGWSRLLIMAKHCMNHVWRNYGLKTMSVFLHT